MEIRVKLLSDATFGRGDGVIGLVDQEIEHDPQTGLPIIRGRTLKGLLVEACADILYALGNAKEWQDAAELLFGKPGSDLEADATMRVGTAQLPQRLGDVVAADVRANRLQPAQILSAMTAIRRQTAVDEATGRPDDTSLRSMRVLLRQTELIAPLTFVNGIKSVTSAVPLLAASVATLRRGGTGRNRGRGRLQCRLWHDGQDVTNDYLAQFKTNIGA